MIEFETWNLESWDRYNLKLDLNYQIYMYTVARESIPTLVEMFYESLCVIYIQFQMALKLGQYSHDSRVSLQW